ncbi:MAG: HAD family hydrolase [Planctomycetota bacterium]|jgi:phosphoglycolate phosphatase-like HAD superfamily hydrolase
MSHLIVFDIDGTLTDTSAVDDRCFARAADDVLGVDVHGADWTAFAHVTDPGIAQELIERHHPGAEPATLHAALERRFMALLEEAIAADPDACRPIAGAADLLAGLTARADVAVSMATGAWRASAELKLRHGGLDRFDVPLATASDDRGRPAIVRRAARLAAARHGIDGFDRVTSVGDGLWDVHAAAAVGCRFVGRGTGAAARRLEAAGVEHVLADYTDRARVLAAFGLDPWSGAAPASRHARPSRTSSAFDDAGPQLPGS